MGTNQSARWNLRRPIGENRAQVLGTNQSGDRIYAGQWENTTVIF